MAHLGPDNGSGERQAGLCVVGEGGLSEEPARVGGVARGGELAEVAAVPGQEDDVDVVAQGQERAPADSPTAPVSTMRLTALRGMETSGSSSAPLTISRPLLTWTRAPSRPT